MKPIFIISFLIMIISCNSVNYPNHSKWLCNKKIACKRHPILEEPKRIEFTRLYNNSKANFKYTDFPNEDERLGSVFIEDPSGNTYLMDGAGNINVNAPKNMSFTAGENVSITAGMNITASAGMNISETAGMNHSSFAGAMMMQNAIADYSLMAANIMEVAQGERKSKAQKVTDQSKEKKIISEEKNEIHTKDTFNNNSGESSKLL